MGTIARLIVLALALAGYVTVIILLKLYIIERRKNRQNELNYEALDKEHTKLIGEGMNYQFEYERLQEKYKKEKDQSEEIRILHENTRRLKHDMKNHILVATSYLNSNEYNEAKNYLSLILDQLNQTYTYIETGNSVLNYIINTKLEYAKQKRIAVKAEIENISFEKMGSFDFSSLLGNILDNAIEASELSSQKEIHVNILRKRGYDTILIKNTIDQSVLKINPELISSKESNGKHGYGIKQIKSIVEKYDGMLDFYEEEKMFCVYVMLLSE